MTTSQLRAMKFIVINLRRSWRRYEIITETVKFCYWNYTGWKYRIRLSCTVLHFRENRISKFVEDACTRCYLKHTQTTRSGSKNLIFILTKSEFTVIPRTFNSSRTKKRRWTHKAGIIIYSTVRASSRMQQRYDSCYFELLHKRMPHLTKFINCVIKRD